MDNTVTNKNTWDLLQVQYPKNFFHGCVCHTVHLMVKDLIKNVTWFSVLYTNSLEVVKLFNKNHRLNYQTKEEQKKKQLNTLKLPGQTRWGSIYKCFTSLIELDDILLNIVSRREFEQVSSRKERIRRNNIKEFITSNNFSKELRKGIDLLEPLQKAITYFQSDSVSVSDVYHFFLRTYDKEYETMNINAQDKRAMKKIFDDRFLFVYGDAHGIGYLLDPVYTGIGMDSETYNAVEELICRWDGVFDERYMIELSSYKAMVELLKKKKPKKVQIVAGKENYSCRFLANTAPVPETTRYCGCCFFRMLFQLFIRKELLRAELHTFQIKKQINFRKGGKIDLHFRK